MGIATALISALLATSPDGFHFGASLGAGYSYDGVAGLRAEARYGQFGVSLGLGRDALPSTESVSLFTDANARSSFPHSLATSARFVSGGSHGLVLSLTWWQQWEFTSGTGFTQHRGDKYDLWQAAAGWRWAGEVFHFEALIGAPYTSNHYYGISDEGPMLPYRAHVTGFGWTGCGRCDLMTWPTIEIGAGISY